MARNVVKIDSNGVGHHEKGKKIEPKNYHCGFPGCTLSYSRQWKRDRHYYSHTGERPFRCETPGCDKTYQSKSHLQRHVKSAHSDAGLLPCMFESCKDTFKNQAALIKHIQNHGRSKKFQCTICLKSFVTEKRLATHKLVHMGVLPFSCHVCDAQWPRASLLRRHMLAHKVVQCEYQSCDATFDSYPNLRKHLKLEHPQGYNCEQCKKSFNNKGILRDHVLIHLPAEDRSVIHCPYKPCKRVYFQKRNLTHHIKVFHNTARYYCNRCSKTCISEAVLKRHVIQKHCKDAEVKLQIIQNLVNITPMEDSHPVDEINVAQYEFRVISRDHF